MTATKIFSILISCSCLIGCVYQVTTFLLHYYSHPTRTEVVKRSSLTFQIPALTICNTNREHFWQFTWMLGNCYTIASNISGKLEPILVTGGNEFIQFSFKFNKSEEYHYMGEPGVQLTIHGMYDFPNVWIDGLSLMYGYKYDIGIKQVDTKLLPSPFNSKCRNYTKAWLSNGKKGALSKSICLVECGWENRYSNCGCYPFYMLGDPLLDNIADKKCQMSENETEKCLKTNLSKQRDCDKDCPRDCEYSTYPAEIKETPYPPNIVLEALKLSKDDYMETTSHHMEVKIRFTTRNVEIIEMIPQLEGIEVFGYIGGFIGMWLGLSFYAFMPHAFDCLNYVHAFKRKFSKVDNKILDKASALQTKLSEKRRHRTHEKFTNIPFQ